MATCASLVQGGKTATLKRPHDSEPPIVLLRAHSWSRRESTSLSTSCGGAAVALLGKWRAPGCAPFFGRGITAQGLAIPETVMLHFIFLLTVVNTPSAWKG